MQETKSKKPKKLVGALISQTSILILSAFLIGHAAGKVVDSSIEAYLYLVGIFGVVAYVGLDHLARQREQRTAARRRKRAAKRLDIRMGRHIPRRIPGQLAGRPASDQPPGDDCQFVPVVQSRQMPAR